MTEKDAIQNLGTIAHSGSLFHFISFCYLFIFIVKNK